jgi:hypothetical protein
MCCAPPPAYRLPTGDLARFVGRARAALRDIVSDSRGGGESRVEFSGLGWTEGERAPKDDKTGDSRPLHFELVTLGA